MVLLFLVCILVGIFVYQRYIPVSGVPAIAEHIKDKDMIILDIRDYQSTSNGPIEGSLNIPYPYLKRYYREIPKGNVIIVASDLIEKNLAIRFLLKRKFSISGFIILDGQRKEGFQQWNIISKQKTG
jgi:rhodanese-related sulfurtransferase